MKAVQYFSEEYLEQTANMSTREILEFLENFRLMHADSKTNRSKLISMKVPEDLLNAFKAKAKAKSTPYQTQIKILMKEWLTKG